MKNLFITFCLLIGCFCLSANVSAQIKAGVGGGVNITFPIAITGEVYGSAPGGEFHLRVKDEKFFEGMLGVGYTRLTPLEDPFLLPDGGGGIAEVRYSNMTLVPLFLEGRFYLPNVKPISPFIGLKTGYHFAFWTVNEQSQFVSSDQTFLSGQPTFGLVGGLNWWVTEDFVLSGEGRYLVMSSSPTEEIWQFLGLHFGLGIYLIDL